jgi:hypothetical protein
MKATKLTMMAMVFVLACLRLTTTARADGSRRRRCHRATSGNAALRVELLIESARGL